jgi:hypothetical protein
MEAFITPGLNVGADEDGLLLSATGTSSVEGFAVDEVKVVRDVDADDDKEEEEEKTDEGEDATEIF